MLRLQSDERLVALVRRGHHGAFEALVSRYQARLLAFCRHMLGSREDAEDVLQEVFAASYNAMLADDRPINVRPWLYRIARNRSLNHLRRAQAIGVDSMDIHLSDNGATTADKVHRREDFRQLIGDVQQLAETQRTALLLREIDALSYEQIAEAMETTVPSVKSLLVRARVALAEAAEARKLTCEEVRDELGEVAEGLRRTSPPVRRHLRTCDRCAAFRKQLRSTNRALALVFPVAPLLLFKKGLLAQLGMTASAGAGTAATGVAASASAAGGASMMSAGISTIATKAAASVAAAAIVTAGAVEVDHVRHAKADPTPVAAAVAPRIPAAAPPKVVTPAPEPVVVASSRQPADEPKAGAAGEKKDGEKGDEGDKAAAGDAPTTPTPADGASAPADGITVALAPTQQGANSVTLPGQPTPPPPGAGGMPGPAEVAAATPPVAVPAAPAVPATPATPPIAADPTATPPAAPVETTPEEPAAPVDPTTPAEPPAATAPAPDPAAETPGPETPAPAAVQPPAPDPVATSATPAP
jgi:RNA polymerase sigma factor (sigma-70 family)